MFGGLMSFLLIVFTAFLGISLLKNFKYSLSQNIKDLTSGNITQEDFIKTNMAKAIGALLLILPGFFTDILGILLQFGILTMVFARIFKTKPTNINTQYTYTRYSHNKTSENNFDYTNKSKINDDIIDVEIINNKIDK
jgi:2-isopropylmalate synthase/UPF0716 protein FxsA